MKPAVYLSLILLLGAIIVVLVLFYRKNNADTSFYHAPPSLPTSGSRFQGMVVLVTGGTSGIGLAAATAFAQQGATVVVCGRTPQKWAQAQTTLPKGVSIVYRQADVRVEKDVQKLVSWMAAKYGKLDIAVNCAGTAPSSFLGETIVPSSVDVKTGSIHYGLPPPQPKSKCASESGSAGCDASTCPVGQQTGASSFCENPVYTDGMGIFYSMKWECNQMEKQSTKGSIVNIASINASWGAVGGILYGAAKGMCLLLTRGAAGEQAPNGIRINCVSPGAVWTPLLATQFPGDQSYSAINKIMKPSIPISRLARPEDIVGPILFLADSTQSGYMTGANVTVDGGMTAAPILQT